MKQLGSDEARRTFRDLLDDAQRGESAEISRNGKPIAVLMPAGASVYVLERDGGHDYGQVAVFVVVAESPDEARRLAAGGAGDEGEAAWLLPDWSSCEAVGSAGQSGVILRDFRAG
jgi:prevent-host-death family protein